MESFQCDVGYIIIEVIMSLTLDVKSKNQLSKRESLELKSEGWATDRSGSQQTMSPRLWESVKPPELQGTST